MKITNNTVLITGGGTGIGASLTKALVQEGNEVIICGRRQERLQEIKDLFPDVHIKICDVTDSNSRNELVDWVLSEFKDFNILVNNAGIQRPIDFLEGTKDINNADDEIATNLLAPIHLSAQFIPHLRNKKEASIINISSGLAFVPMARIPVYCASKAALHSWCLSLRYQLRETSIKVFEINPPIVSSELTPYHHQQINNPEVMTTTETAKGILKALETDSFQTALGNAVNLRDKKETMFSILNP